MEFEKFKIKPVNGRSGKIYNCLLLFDQHTITSKDKRLTNVSYVIFNDAQLLSGANIAINDLAGEKDFVTFENLEGVQLDYTKVKDFVFQKLKVEVIQ